MTIAYRMERIERLLEELKYEITRGMLEAEIDEYISFRFIVPVSKQLQDGVVKCEFRTHPIYAHSMGMDYMEKPQLRIGEQG